MDQASYELNVQQIKLDLKRALVKDLAKLAASGEPKALEFLTSCMSARAVERFLLGLDAGTGR